MNLRPEEVERALLNCMSSNRQIPFASYHYDRIALLSSNYTGPIIIYTFHVRKNRYVVVHRAGHVGSSIATLLFFQGLCEPLIRPT